MKPPERRGCSRGEGEGEGGGGGEGEGGGGALHMSTIAT